MAIKPILFNTEMVKAILDGKKTQTRRAIRPQPSRRIEKRPGFILWGSTSEMGIWKPPANKGDLLWVRESWKQYTAGTAGPGLIDGYLYKADEPQDTTGMMVEGRWHPSIHMPFRAARIFLRVTDVRCERLCEIDDEGVCAEGAEQIIMGCEHMDYSFTPPEICFNANPCKDCIINYGYPELFGKMVWNKTLKPADVASYGWDANPWVWVIEFERTEQDTPF